MDEDIIIGIDLSKNVFQLHGARRDGQVLFRKKLSRPQFRTFCAKKPQVPDGNGGLFHVSLLGARVAGHGP